MGRRAAVLPVAVVVGCLALVLAGAVAAPPPTNVCVVCHGELDGAASPGTLDIHLDDDGDARWVERVPVTAETARTFRENPQQRADAVAEAWTRPLLADDATNRSSTVDGNTLVVSYTVAGVAERGVGDTWLVTYFLGDDASTRYHVGGERVTLHPPVDRAVTNRVPGGEHTGGTVTWRGDASNRPDRALDPATVVTYGSGGPGSVLLSFLTVLVALGPQLLANGLVAGALPTVFLAGCALAAVRYPPTGRVLGRLSTRLRSAGPGQFGRLLAAGAGLSGAVALLVGLSGQTGWLVGFGLGAVGYAALTVAAGRLAGRGVRGLLAGVLGVTAGCGLALLALRAPAGWALLVLPTVAFLPLGYAAEARSRMLPPLALVLAGPTLALAVSVPVYLPGGWVFLTGLLFVPSVVGVGLAGYPLSVLGRLLAAEGHPVVRDG